MRDPLLWLWLMPHVDQTASSLSPKMKVTSKKLSVLPEMAEPRCSLSATWMTCCLAAFDTRCPSSLVPLSTHVTDVLDSFLALRNAQGAGLKRCTIAAERAKRQLGLPINSLIKPPRGHLIHLGLD